MSLLLERVLLYNCLKTFKYFGELSCLSDLNYKRYEIKHWVNSGKGANEPMQLLLWIPALLFFFSIITKMEPTLRDVNITLSEMDECTRLAFFIVEALSNWTENDERMPKLDKLTKMRGAWNFHEWPKKRSACEIHARPRNKHVQKGNTGEDCFSRARAFLVFESRFLIRAFLLFIN